MSQHDPIGYLWVGQLGTHFPHGSGEATTMAVLSYNIFFLLLDDHEKNGSLSMSKSIIFINHV